MSAFIAQRKADFGVEPICQTLGVSASAYYRRASGERSDRAVADERLLAQIRRVHEANYESQGPTPEGHSSISHTAPPM